MRFSLYILVVFSSINAMAQEWSLRLKSRVELRTFKLTNKAEVSEQGLSGASVVLYKGSTVVSQVQSDGNGDFEIFVPANGDYILAVSHPGCNTKKFQVNTMGVPEKITGDNYKPSFGIEGVIMARSFPGINYSILNQPLVKVLYMDRGKKFDDDEAYTNQMLGAIGSYRNDETLLIDRFCSTNAAGDEALKKGDCPLAKAKYEEAMKMIPGEFYPKQQLELVGKCLKDKEAQDKAKQEAEKLAAEKAAAEKLAAEQAAKAKEEAERLAKEQAAKQKAEQEKLAAEKAAAEKLAAEQAAKAKEEAERLAKEQVAKQKAEQEKLAAEKAAAEKLAAEQAAKAKEEAERLAKEQVAKQKSEQEKQAAEKAAAEKLAKEQAAKAKEDELKNAKEKKEQDKLAKEKAIKEKQEAERLAKENELQAKLAAEKAEQERLAADKLKKESEEKEKAEKDRLAQEEANKKMESKGLVPVYSGGETETKSGSSDSKYSVPKALGADKYKETIKRAEELFKMKRYAEAKPVYQEALKQKPNDYLATNRLAEIEKLLNK